MAVMASVLPEKVGGLPLHPLVVHAVVVLVPLAVLGAIGISLWPAMRRHLGLLVLLFSGLALVSVPLATSSGESFRDALGAEQLVRQHEEYADKLLPLTAALVLFVALTMIVDLARRLGPLSAPAGSPTAGSSTPSGETLPSGGGGLAVATRPVQEDVVAGRTTRLDRALGRFFPAALRDNDRLLRAAGPVLAVFTVVVALVLAYYVYKTGDSGAKAVWNGR